jgi:hypothetical protein
MISDLAPSLLLEGSRFGFVAFACFRLRRSNTATTPATIKRIKQAPPTPMPMYKARLSGDFSPPAAKGPAAEDVLADMVIDAVAVMLAVVVTTLVEEIESPVVVEDDMVRFVGPVSVNGGVSVGIDVRGVGAGVGEGVGEGVGAGVGAGVGT